MLQLGETEGKKKVRKFVPWQENGHFLFSRHIFPVWLNTKPDELVCLQHVPLHFITLLSL